jgi:hypothetical protein
MINALGLLEVEGMVAAVDAADAMLRRPMCACSVMKCSTRAG